MAKSNQLIPISDLKNKIFTFRGLQVMIDRDLAELYGVEVKRLNEQVKRNIERFPVNFRFQINNNEKNELVANCDRFNKLKHSSVNPHAFTEQGVSMLSAVLRSETAIKVSISIINAFVQMRRFIADNAGIFQRLEQIEIKQIQADKKFEQVFKALEEKELNSYQGIFYDGQIFDAYAFVSGLIKSAKKSIILIDNYVDETVLTLLAKRSEAVDAYIYTRSITKQLRLDIKKHNQQYPAIKVKGFTKSHDRFLIIDNETVYHIGASLKDLGKRWFAFSKMEMDSIELINKLELNAQN
ncbi:MAG: ORF6N domain-containing protein [Candidatus Delongbacteria bacterium]|jgi:hypothetical protein|nr:ORF6N domain-containing protein [Candidatus Delongbacteria bacterium]